MNETWLPVVGYEGHYEVSDQGRVRSVDRVDRRGWNRQGQLRRLSAHVTDGRPTVRLLKDGRGQTLYVHRLVLEAFVGQCPEGHECCHGNGDNQDNRLSNLRWDTRSANQFDAVKHGAHALSARRECKRGHQLEVPNLCNYGIRRGVRACLACNKGRDYVNRHGGTLQAAADRFYAAIMSGEFRQREVQPCLT